MGGCFEEKQLHTPRASFVLRGTSPPEPYWTGAPCSPRRTRAGYVFFECFHFTGPLLSLKATASTH